MIATSPRHALLLVGLFFSTGLSAQQTATEQSLTDAIDAIGEMAVDSPVAGLSIAVDRRGETLHAKGYGFANLEHEIPAAADTVYRIGSVTKQFTAAAILQLVDQGKLSLDDDLTDFLPDYPVQGHRVTVRHLLNHTSGIQTFTSTRGYRENMPLDRSHAEVLAWFQDQPFNFAPGEDYRYNNSGYYLLGMVIEKVSGQSYEGYLKEKVFEPLGLTDTHYDLARKIIKRRSEGYSRSFQGLVHAPYLSMHLPFAAGAIASNVSDLIRWQRALFAGEVMSADSLRQMTTAGQLSDGSPLTYGFGLSVGELDGHRKIAHGGSINGFRSTLAYYPDDGVTIAILANTDGAIPGRMEEQIARLVFGAKEDLDLLIRGATVVDGTGKPRVVTDVGIRNGVITLVGPAENTQARETIDGRNLVLAPGFIDVHNHTAPAIANPGRRFNEGFVRQGVTTVVGGPDGSMAPSQIKQLIAAYGRNGIGTNVAFYVGHNAIRREVMGGDQQRAPTPAELETMKALVREGMELGAVGLSTGLMYEPGLFSETEEVIALASAVAPFGGTYDSHVRNPVHDLLGSDREVLRIGEEAGIPAKIGHLKAVGLQNAGAIREVIQMVERARSRGQRVVSDQYPYDGAQTSSLRGIIVSPPGLRRGVDLQSALRDPDQRSLLREASENGIDGGFAWLKATGYSSMRIVKSPDFPGLVGKYLSQLAEERRVEPFDLVCELLLAAKSPVQITLGAILEDDVQRLLVQPWNMVASDGAYTNPNSPGRGGHPRSTGTFPRVLGHYVRELEVLTLEDAIRKMTSLPAEFIGLRDRGRIAVDAPADLVLFDPEVISDRSTWDEPGLLAEGVLHVFVAGVPVLQNGALTGESPGRFLPRQPPRTVKLPAK